MARKKKIPLFKQKQKIVEIQWVDAQGEDEWEYLSEIDKSAMYIKSVGYFLDETEEEIIICRSLSSDKGLEGRFHIPKDCIKKTKTIKK
jgi:hypothetical protein